MWRSFCRPSSLVFWSVSWILQQLQPQTDEASVCIWCRMLSLVGVLTDSQLPQAALKLWFLLQDPQQVRGLHVLQLHLPVDIDFVTEAHVNQTGAVLPLLTCVLTCQDTRNINNIRTCNRKLLLIMLWFSVSCEYRWTHQQSSAARLIIISPWIRANIHTDTETNLICLNDHRELAEGRNSVGAKKESAVETGGSNEVSCLFL